MNRGDCSYLLSYQDHPGSIHLTLIFSYAFYICNYRDAGN